MKAAGEARGHTAQAHAQVDRLLAQLGESSELATALDEAVMHEDREAVVELLKQRGLEGEIRIEKLEADRAVTFALCAFLDKYCVMVTIAW
jgi:hypothetical protein